MFDSFFLSSLEIVTAVFFPLVNNVAMKETVVLY